MGRSNRANFSTHHNELADIARALSHPARIAIVEHLLEVDQCICGDIVNQIPLAQPTISRHLSELKNIGIIKGAIHGTRINYCIDEERWKSIGAIFNELLSRQVPTHSCNT